MELELYILLFFTGCLAGWVDTIAGGGGLLAVPALLMTGIPLEAVMATNKLQGTGGTLISSTYFIRKKFIDLNQNKLMIATTFIGAVSGSWLLLHLKPGFLEIILPILLIMTGLYFLFSPRVGDVQRKQRISYIGFALLITSVLGFYDGFFGPGTGTFMALAFVSLRGYTLAQSTSHAKLLNFTSNIAALSYFIFFGEIYWDLGLVMIAGQVLGATVGAKMVITKGATLVKPIIVIVCFGISFNYIFKTFF